MRVLLMYGPSESHLKELRSVAPTAEFLIADSEDDAKSKIALADVVLGNRFFLQSLPFAEKLQWMQSGSSGMDLLLRGAFPNSLSITSARGVYDDEIVEHAIALVFSLIRGLHRFRDAQKKGQWHRAPLLRMSQLRALILGWGGIGRGIGQRLQSFGAEVRGVALHTQAPFLHGVEEWKRLLPQTNLLIVALPLTRSTRQFVSAEAFEQLPDGAYLVNIGRGGTIDENALLAYLQKGKLAGAALDVFVEEPLPPSHPLWLEERLMITPHVGRSLESAPYRWEPLFVENLRRFYSGEPLLNLIDQEAGY